MSSFESILHGLKLSLKDFIEKHLPIESNYASVTSFTGFLNSTNDRIINERKGELLEYFIHQFLEKNGIISFINKTLVYLNKNNMPRISDGNIDLHGQYKLLIFLIQSKCKILVKDLREFLHTISNQPKTSVGFLVSSVELGDNARIELENSPIKERICVCFYYEIVDKIFEYARNSFGFNRHSIGKKHITIDAFPDNVFLSLFENEENFKYMPSQQKYQCVLEGTGGEEKLKRIFKYDEIIFREDINTST
ncbi:5805_t:CDS:2 [Gigaspora margarita]|uniref:5805_t:CDS:1 n=1 Tax=Gigaspora margarita TaxID=4874 RepID=A0ABN7WC69_GIGMA|nr:5805_t:CDS:2 [Gigaspora margarita]